MSAGTLPHADLREEAVRVPGAAEAGGGRPAGHGRGGRESPVPRGSRPSAGKDVQDLDLVGRRGDVRAITDLLRSLGYEPDEDFNALHGHKLLYFWDPRNGRQLDVFVEGVRVLHSAQEVREPLEEATKSVRWRLRSIVGERMRWYELPEETGA